MLQRPCWRHCLALSITTIAWRFSASTSLPWTTNTILVICQELQRTIHANSRKSTDCLAYVRMQTNPKLTRGNIESVVLACYESTIPEDWRRSTYVLQLFTPLPYSRAPALSYNNEQRFFGRHNVATANASYSHMFPSGSMGVNLTKPLHDDKIEVTGLGLWQCIQADPENRDNETFFTNTC